MVLMVLVTILILAIAFFQVTQGFYSATIMAILSVLSAVVAFNTYEPLGRLLQPYQPTAADAIALGTIFVAVLLGLRLAIDYFLRSNAVMGVWVDRIGGGLVGLLTGVILVGVLAVVVQMLPWGASILGYRPFDDALQRHSRLYLFAPDDFLLGMLKTLSDQSLAGRSTRPFAGAHDDLVLELFCARNTAGRHGRIDAPVGSLSVGDAYTSEGAPWGGDVPPDPRLGDQITKVIIVCATIDRSAADKDRWWRLPGTHFRLIGKSGRSYYPVGHYVALPAAGGIEFVPAPTVEGRLQVAQLIVEEPAGKNRHLAINWAYRILPEDAPDYLVFRRVSSAPVSKPSTRFPDLTGGLETTRKE